MKQPFQPFSITFKPLLDEIMGREKALRELTSGAAMVEILGKHPDVEYLLLDRLGNLSAAACGLACPLLHKQTSLKFARSHLRGERIPV